jgi:hypothetical protein
MDQGALHRQMDQGVALAQVNLLVFRGGWLTVSFQGTAASNPIGDAHAVSRITDINVDGVVRVDMSAYQDEATNGRL